MQSRFRFSNEVSAVATLTSHLPIVTVGMLRVDSCEAIVLLLTICDMWTRVLEAKCLFQLTEPVSVSRFETRTAEARCLNHGQVWAFN